MRTAASDRCSGERGLLAVLALTLGLQSRSAPPRSLAIRDAVRLRRLRARLVECEHLQRPGIAVVSPEDCTAESFPDPQPCAAKTATSTGTASRARERRNRQFLFTMSPSVKVDADVRLPTGYKSEALAVSALRLGLPSCGYDMAATAGP
jgi:hypothetical protein